MLKPEIKMFITPRMALDALGDARRVLRELQVPIADRSVPERGQE